CPSRRRRASARRHLAREPATERRGPTAPRPGPWRTWRLANEAKYSPSITHESARCWLRKHQPKDRAKSVLFHAHELHAAVQRAVALVVVRHDRPVEAVAHGGQA